MGFEWLAIAMFLGFFLILMSGYPVSFSFAGTGLVFGLVGWLVGAFDVDRLFLLSNNWFGTMSNFTLLAIPFFVFLEISFRNQPPICVPVLPQGN